MFVWLLLTLKKIPFIYILFQSDPPYDVKVVTKSSVRENDSAELTCSSDSNPPANNYQWFSLNGTLLGNGTTYKLEKVSRHTESISCTAINPFGKNSSSPRKLNILCKHV